MTSLEKAVQIMQNEQVRREWEQIFVREGMPIDEAKQAVEWIIESGISRRGVVESGFASASGGQ